MHVGRVRLFFSFKHGGKTHECAAVHWFWRTADTPDEDTGMWVVSPGRHIDPEVDENEHMAFISVINVSSIIRAAHLHGVNTNLEVEEKMHAYESLDTYRMFFVNKYIDHHAFDLLHPLRVPTSPYVPT